MEETFLPNTFPLQVDNGNIPYLTEAAKWAKFLSIVGFIFCALIIIFGLFASPYISNYFDQIEPGSSQDIKAISGTFLKIFYILIALVYFLPCLYLFNFASKMQTALRLNDQVSLNISFRNLKSCFKYWAIMLIIIICIYALAITFAVVLGLGFGS
jgi:Family of unknown function (DUF5362)